MQAKGSIFARRRVQKLEILNSGMKSEIGLPLISTSLREFQAKKYSIEDC